MSKGQLQDSGEHSVSKADLDASDPELLFDHLYENYEPMVERWVRRLAGPSADVEDLVHDVFVVALRRRGEFRGEAKVSTWLFRITELVVRKRRFRRKLRQCLDVLHRSHEIAVVTAQPDAARSGRAEAAGCQALRRPGSAARQVPHGHHPVRHRKRRGRGSRAASGTHSQCGLGARPSRAGHASRTVDT